MPFIYSYALKDLHNRMNTDLTHFQVAIEQSVNYVFKERVINISTYKTYFEFTLTDSASDTELRQMGKEIAKNEASLNEIKKDYGYSTQLLKRINFDVVLKDDFSNSIAIIEIKNNNYGFNAGKVFRNMVAHNLIPNVQYFLIITQISGYLWKNTNILKISEPNLEFPMGDIIKRYLYNSEIDTLRHGELQLVVTQWLNQISRNLINKDKFTESEKQLKGIGFIDAIHNSTILSEVEL